MTSLWLSNSSRCCSCKYHKELRNRGNFSLHLIDNDFISYNKINKSNPYSSSLHIGSHSVIWESSSIETSAEILSPFSWQACLPDNLSGFSDYPCPMTVLNRQGRSNDGYYDLQVYTRERVYVRVDDEILRRARFNLQNTEADGQCIMHTMRLSSLSEDASFSHKPTNKADFR